VEFRFLTPCYLVVGYRRLEGTTTCRLLKTRGSSSSFSHAESHSGDVRKVIIHKNECHSPSNFDVTRNATEHSGRGGGGGAGTAACTNNPKANATLYVGLQQLRNTKLCNNVPIIYGSWKQDNFYSMNSEFVLLRGNCISSHFQITLKYNVAS
jgi:hypothetical protein